MNDIKSSDPTDAQWRVEELFVQLFRTDLLLAELKTVKKELHKLLPKLERSYRLSPAHKANLHKLVCSIRVQPDMKCRTELIRALSNMYFFFDAPKEFIVETAELILESLTNASGDVREAARRMSGNWRLHDPSHILDVDEHTKNFIKKLVDLIKHHAPAFNHLPIEQMPPSVYKSLLLAYEEVVRGLYVKEWVRKNPDLIIEIISEDLTPVYDRSSQIPLLWKRYSCESVTKQKAENLANEAYKRLDYFFVQAGFTTQKINNLRSLIAIANTPMEQEKVIEKIAGYARQKNQPLSELTPIMREFQTVMNHTARFHGDQFFTYFLLSAQTDCTEQNLKHKIDWNQWVAYVTQVHENINVFEQEFDKVEEEQFKLWHERFLQIAPEMATDLQEDTKSRQLKLKDSISSAHYICDWLMQTYPTFTSKEPRKFAALCLGAVREINQGMTPFNGHHLAPFGGWKSLAQF